MCCGYAYAPWRSTEKIQCMNDKCRYYGDTVVPFTSTVSFQRYEDMKQAMGEQDMCNETNYWHLNIGANSNGRTYRVEFTRKDGKTSDAFGREFDSFGDALEFANSTYEEIK